MPVVRGIRVLNAISTGNTTPGCLDTLLSDPGRLADVTQVLSSPQYSCALAQSNTAAHTLVRSNNAMTALFANPIGSCIFYQTTNSRDDMLGSTCYYNYKMSFATPEATNAFFHFGNSPAMMDCAFASCTAFLNTAVQSNTEIAKLLTCNSCVSACFRGSTCAIQQAVGTPGRPAYWLGDATAFGCLVASGLPTAFGNTVFLETLNRDIACVMCSPTLNCCAWNLASPANTYTRSVCATNEVVNKGACGAGLTSCNFVCWYASTYGVPCMASYLQSGNTYFMDQFNALNSFRQRSCMFFLCSCRDNCYNSFFAGQPTSSGAEKAHLIAKSEMIGRGGVFTANNANLPMINYTHCYGQRICPFTIANGSQLSNTEIEYLGRFVKCNYNTITHADCRFTLISPGFWNQSSNIACFKNCYCCTLNRTTANTSGLTLNCSLYYTTDNAASFNRLCVPLPACIFQQLCGNVCCQFAVRYGMSSFACCNYIYTGWIISDCSTNNGQCCTPAFFKTGHSRVCIHTANSQPNYDTWTHFPDVPLPFYTVAFCDEYFAGVSPMRTDGYQTTLGICNQLCCKPEGQWAMMFSFGRVGDCVRVSCDNFVNCDLGGRIKCFTPATCCNACKAVSALTSANWGTCFLDYFQGHGGTFQAGCVCFSPHGACIDGGGGNPRPSQNPAATSHTLIYRDSANTADSKAFLVGWRSFGMLYGGNDDLSGCQSCAVIGPTTAFPYNCCNLRAEATPAGCGYFRNSPGVNVWCYGSQANNTMQGSEIICDALGCSTDAWTNFSLSNAKIIGCRLVLAGAFPPIMHLCACFSCADHSTGATAFGYSRNHLGGAYGCQNIMGQTGHTTVFNTNGVVGTTVCCFDMMFHQTPFNANLDGQIQCMALQCTYCSGACLTCSGHCNCYAFGVYWFSSPATSDQAGLKTINFYGTSNSSYSIPAFPNQAPVTACCRTGCSHGSYSAGCLSCYTSPAITGETPYKSNKGAYCVIDFGDSTVCQFGSNCGPLRPDMDGYRHICNPGVANAVGMAVRSTIFATSAYQPCHFSGVYTPPTTSQDMSTFDSTFNFCYIITPHRDFNLCGPYCWSPGCECFPPGAVVPCNPCCPCCNTRLCCVTGFCQGSQISDWKMCDITRACGYEKQHFCVNCLDGVFPCVQTPPRYCCSAFAGCTGLGNHHRTTAAANSTFQCATRTDFHTICPIPVIIESCCCSAQNTCCYIRPYDKLLRTCNQAGPNCMWYDYMTSGVIGFTISDSVCHLPCLNYFNSQYVMGINLDSTPTSLCAQGLAYMAADDSKRAGHRIYSSATCTAFIVNDVCYPILYAQQTRGAGGVTNTQNSIHIAYFDLAPYRCVVLAGSFGFYANGNACPGPSGITCCLMFSKLDIFYNVG